jgi:hypothetical protein
VLANATIQRLFTAVPWPTASSSIDAARYGSTAAMARARAWSAHASDVGVEQTLVAAEQCGVDQEVQDSIRPAGRVLLGGGDNPSFNSALIAVRVVKKDDAGAEFVADRKTKIGRHVRAYDRYQQHRDLVVERTYEGNDSARSTWTIHPVDADHCTLTIDASQSMGPVRGLVMKPFLKKLFYGINFTPFINEAERRATAPKGVAV